jgi:hypothetical protein
MKFDQNQICQALDHLGEYFRQAGSISILAADVEKEISPGVKLDAIAELRLPDKKRVRLWIEFIPRGQPAPARRAALQVKNYIEEYGENNDFPVVAAPGLSSQALRVCREMGVNAFDMIGNCRFQIGSILIDISGRSPKKEERSLKSVFSRKSSRVIRLLLLNRLRPWKVKELKEMAEVSIGMIPQIKQVLIDWELGRKTKDGFELTDPEALLEKWSEVYSREEIATDSFFSLGQPRRIEEQIIKAAQEHNVPAALGAFSGASRVAPAVRYNVVDAYVFGDQGNLGKIAQFCGFKEVDSGQNVRLHLCPDRFLYNLSQEADSIRVMDDIQLFLDLKQLPGRGEEAAQELLKQRIRPRWQS